MMALGQKMRFERKSYRSLSREVSGFSGLNIDHRDVFNFVHSHLRKIGSQKKKELRQYFQSIGWIKKPAPRKPPVCRRCGLQYPTRKLQKRISSGNHKRTTKLSQ
jgi:hypothetical protein